jgi:hypothetical protein
MGTSVSPCPRRVSTMAFTSVVDLPPHPHRSSTVATGAPSVAQLEAVTATRAASRASSARPRCSGAG